MSKPKIDREEFTSLIDVLSTNPGRLRKRQTTMPKLKFRTKVELERYLDYLRLDHDYTIQQVLAQLTIVSNQRDRALGVGMPQHFNNILHELSDACPHELKRPNKKCSVCNTRKYIWEAQRQFTY
jgi:hypothetical protein